jgi:hypothetical protein
MFANQLADFWRFTATIRALLQQIKADVDRVWLEYETEKWPALTEQ